jgi:glutamyl-tRNA synthetase
MTDNLNNAYRFAPSPTGLLHVGGARTAIFNWLLAKKNGGKFLLRIEDTDEKRSSKESLEQILSSLKWLNIDWDGQPLFQSKQKKRHQQVGQELLEQNKVYRCFCTPQLLQEERRKAAVNKKAFIYTGRCRYLSSLEIKSNLRKNLPFTLRLRLVEGETTFNDLVRGTVTVKHAELDDFVIIRSDGSPVYHLAVVIDDHDMGITHIVRGDDHLSNTPKQILIHRALGWQIPHYAHVPLISGQDGARLSKRHGATAIEDFRKKGILSDALFNYLCLLGWAPGDDSEIMSRDEIIERFSLDRVGKKDAIFDEKKLIWINGKYLSQKSTEEIVRLLHRYLTKHELKLVEKNKEKFMDLIGLVKIRAQTIKEVYEKSRFFLVDPETYEKKGAEMYFKDRQTVNWFEDLSKFLKDESVFESEQLEKIIRTFAELKGIKAAQLIHPLRLALTGRTTSPGIFEVMEILDRDTVVRRVDKAIKFIRQELLNSHSSPMR